MSEPARRPFRASILGKIVPSLLAGSLVFGITAVTRQDTIQGVLLSVLVSAIVLLIQFLADFEKSIDSLRVSQDEGLADFSKATRLYDRVGRSPADRAHVDFLLSQVGGLGGDTHPLLLDLVNLEIGRLGQFVKQVREAGWLGGTAPATGSDEPFSISYDGEDREWLLALTAAARSSIDAISLSTIDAGVTNYDGGLWRSDLGHRYIEMQRTAVRRGLRIRRIFYFDRPEIVQDAVLRDICGRQRAIGVDVRLLDNAVLPRDLRTLMSDFIVFDTGLAYEMSSAVALADGHRPERLTTYLSVKHERVQDLHARFERLWARAAEPDWEQWQAESRPPGSAAGRGAL
jgi:hypothetical protein